MTAPNHALTGALIGLTIANPAVAIPIAFLSHFALDAVPHYDRPAVEESKRLRSRQFLLEFLLLGGGLCLLIVVLLVTARPAHWITAVICAFAAAAPDLMWLPKFIAAKRGHKMPQENWLWHFHGKIQWSTSPAGVWVELVWFAVAGAFFVGFL